MVTHKELLTFSNLTNLEWEFVELYDKETGRKKDNTFLRDLLDPENFVRYDAEKDMYSYPYLEGRYGKDINFTDEEREEGLQEMRKDAGIAMEYLEKLNTGNSEGDFLKD